MFLSFCLHIVNVVLALVTNTFLVLVHKSLEFNKECEQQMMGAGRSRYLNCYCEASC